MPGTVNATRLMKNYKINKLILASVWLRVVAVAVSVLVLTSCGDMVVQPVLRCVNVKQNVLSNTNTHNFCSRIVAE